MQRYDFFCTFAKLFDKLYLFIYKYAQMSTPQSPISNLQSAISNIIARYPSDQIFVLLDSGLSADINDGYTKDKRRINEGYTNDYPVLMLSTSEDHKTLETVQHIWDFLLEHHATRQALLINIGGGILTDMGGFAAATYKRGIDYVNIPTTLLAMVDAAHGGKTGINYHGLKNHIGVFREPVATLIEPAFLTTLDTYTFLSGYAELIKTALLDSDDFFAQSLAYLEDYISSEQSPITHNLSPLINRAIAVKQRIVAADPTEQGLRKALNLGHTIGHALEELGSVSFTHAPITHGYAVLYGIVAELYLSQRLLPDCDTSLLQRLTRVLIDVYGKPTCSCRDYDRLIELMRSDKKNASADQINFTLLKKAGDPVINQVATPSQIREALDYLFSL